MNKIIYLLKLLTAFTFALVTAPFAFAADINAVCYTEVGGTTTFVIETADEKVNFSVINHHGGGYAPFWQSLVVPNDLSVLEKKAEVIRKIDTGFSASWKPTQCKWTGPKKFSCMGATDKVEANGVVIEPWAIYSNVVSESSFAGDYTYVDMTVSFEVDNEDFNITMRYQEHECTIQEQRIAGKTVIKKKK